MANSRTALVLAATILSLQFQSAFAQAPAPTVSPTAPAAAPRQPLEAGAQVVVLTLNDLRNVGLDIKHLSSAAQHLYDEVTIQPVSLQTMPEMIGPGMIINIPIGTQPVGQIAPAKPERVNAAMTQIRAIASLMKTDVDAFMNGEKQLEMPGDAKQQLQPQLQGWVEYVNNVYAQFNALETLTASAPYNQPAIANGAANIVTDCKELEKLRREIHRVLQKEGKREAALEKRGGR